MIKGERITLKALEPSDANAVLELMEDSEISRYMTPSVAELTPNNILPFFFQTEPGTQCISFGIFNNETAEMIGFCVISNIHSIHRSAYIKFIAIKTALWNEKYAQEAFYHIAKYLFNDRNLRRIYCHTIAENVVMDNVTKVGFRLEGVEKKWGWFEDGWRDRKTWGCLKKEFDFGIIDKIKPKEEEV